MIRRIGIFVLLLAAAACGAVAASERGALVRVDHPPAGAAGRLLDAGVTVVRNLDDYLLVVADSEDLVSLDRLGFSYDVLDESVEGKTFYIVFRLRPEKIDELASLSRPLHAAEYGSVVEATPLEAERLAQAGFDIVRVFLRPVVAPAPARDTIVPRLAMQADPPVQAMVDDVSGASIDWYVQRLQDFVTRWAPHDSCQAAADWIKAEFESFGIDSVYFQNFHTLYKDNVVAVMPGQSYPDEVVIIGGHYDTAAGDPYDAPGADDNASGTACVLECARVMSTHQFDRTLVFIAFGAEEQGLMGSEYYAAEAVANGENIVAMLNVDMIGYLASGDVVDLDVISNTSSEWLRDRALSAGAIYVPGFAVVDGETPDGAGSDHISFWDQGYDAIMFFEDTDQYSPYIHTSADTIGLSYNHPDLAHQSVRVAVALIAELARPTDSVVGGGETPAATLISLDQNVPNPFNPRTMIRFTVPPPGAAASLRIYDVAGREVAVLVDNEIVVGSRQAWWNGTNRNGKTVPSGVYFYRLTAGREALTRKLVLVR